ncbi:MAG: response regulator, partial [Alistipes sp.]|nr:response regulator [Alistipes sp.]
RLLELTNQLLDFQKIEKERLPVSLVRHNTAEILKAVFYRFSSSARQQGKSFELSIENENACAHIDREAFTKILSNLLNNALKYSDSMIHVELKTDGDTLFVTVTNDGEVVPPDMREAIFAPFFRHTRKSESVGTGIGLALARSLAELQSGTLAMGPSERLNEFVLTLPLIREPETGRPETTQEEYADSATELSAESRPDTCCILIVEDNPEMCAFIKRQVAEHYSVLTAGNGVEAQKVLENNYVDLIVCDIMMPEMDGIELCKQVKNDLRYSHIPLILLTAKTNLQSKISGMEAGADAYVEKPFSPEYLLSVIANLIKSRRKLRESFTQNPLVLANTMATSSADTDFIVRLQEIIHANFNNPEFKMNDIAEMMHMSRASFYRKIKGVLDMTPNDYLRLERLKTAAQLLQDRRYHINEVCYMVGFSSTSYFAKCFQKQFGVLPKKFFADTSGRSESEEQEE